MGFLALQHEARPSSTSIEGFANKTRNFGLILDFSPGYYLHAHDIEIESIYAQERVYTFMHRNVSTQDTISKR